MAVENFVAISYAEQDKKRVENLLDLLPKGLAAVLDAGARTGAISMQLISHFSSVTALDLEAPKIDNPIINCVKGDITELNYPDSEFDVVVCSEVLEHIPAHLLEKACSELSRVAKSYVLIGVPYRQDIRFGQTTCANCGTVNPPWGHVNSFDEFRLAKLFSTLCIKETAFVGQTRNRTNCVSAWLNNFAGNPWGTYSQEEKCIHCSSKLVPPASNLFTKGVAKLAYLINLVQIYFIKPQPNWIHILFEKN